MFFFFFWGGGLGLGVQALGFRIGGFRIWGLEFRVEGLGCWVQGFGGFRVWALGCWGGLGCCGVRVLRAFGVYGP